MYSNTVGQIKHIGNRFYGKKYHSRVAYFKSANLIQNYKKLYEVAAPVLDTHEEMQCEEVFLPLGVSFLSSMRTVTKQLQSPYYYSNNQKIKNHEVLFFKKVIGDVKMNIQMHFLNNQLFYIHNEIRHHLLLSYLKNEEILKLMLERYYTGDLDNYENRDIVLKDINNNQIFTSSQVCFGISYLTGSPEFKEEIAHLQRYMERREESKLESKTELLLNFI